MSGDSRAIGPDMKAEGWTGIGESLWWLHTPSQRSVSIDSYKRGNVSGDGLASDEGEPDDDGFVVACRLHDEHGNPVDGESVWVRSYADAVRRARSLRTQILAERRDVTFADQLAIPGTEGSR